MSKYIDDERPIEEYLKHVKAEKSKSTLQNRRVTMRQWHRYLRSHDDTVYEAGTAAVKSFRTELRLDGYAPRSIRNKLYDISSLYNFLMEYELVSENPVDDHETADLSASKYQQETTREGRYLDVSEFKELLAASRDMRDRVLIHLMWSTGVRAVEAVNIRVSELDRDERSVPIETAKQDDIEERTVYWSKSFDDLLYRWLEKGGRSAWLGETEDNGYLVPSHSETRMHPSTVNERVRETAKEAGIQEVVYVNQAGQPQHRVNSHILRHSYAVHATKRGMPIIFLRDLLGHSDIEQTRTYLQYRDDDRKEAARTYRASV